MSNIFCLKNLQENTLAPNYENILVYSQVEESFSSECFKALINFNEEYNNANKGYYKAVLEANGDATVINESFSDFIAKVKEIIKKFIDLIKSLFQRFVTMLHKIVKSDKYIKNHKSDLLAFDSRDEFEIDGYNFTINPDIPLINAQADFNQDFVGINFDINKGEKFLDVVEKAYDKLMSEIDDGKYDHYRALVIGQNGYIAQEDYGDELFECFRDGMSTTAKINITSSHVSQAMARFENYDKTINATKKKKESLEKEYNEIEKKIEHMVKAIKDKDAKNVLTVNVDSEYYTPKDNIKVTSEEMNKLDLFIKAKVNEVIEISSIHSMAFSYKLDAYKSCMDQDKNILYKSLSQIQKNHKGEL